MDALKAAVDRAAANVVPFLDQGPDADRLVAERFWQNGLPRAYTEALMPEAEKVIKLLREGAFLASLSARFSAAANETEGEAS
jgi:hypothetical protein